MHATTTMQASSGPPRPPCHCIFLVVVASSNSLNFQILVLLPAFDQEYIDRGTCTLHAEPAGLASIWTNVEADRQLAKIMINKIDQQRAKFL